jgi:hypothetical protein
MYTPNPPHLPPALNECLAMWGWAVQHGNIPLDYAATVLAEHSCYSGERNGVPDATADDRRAWAAEDLADWEDVVVEMTWPGDDAVEKERWDLSADWEFRAYLLKRLGLVFSVESTDRMLRRYCEEQIAECERQLTEKADRLDEEFRADFANPDRPDEGPDS